MTAAIEFVVTVGYSIALMYMLLDFEVKANKGIYIMGVFMSLLLLLGAFAWVTLGYDSFMILYPIFVQTPLYIAFWLFSKYKGMKLLFVLLTVMALSSLPVLAGEIISSFFGNDVVIRLVVTIIIYLPIGLIVYKYFRPLFLYMLRNTNIGWLTFCLIPLSYNIYTFIMGRYNVDVIKDQLVLLLDSTVAVLIIVAYVLILRFFKQTRENLILENEENILVIQSSSLKAQSEAIQESEEKTNICRDDLLRHLTMINRFVEDNNLGKIEEYISDVEKNIEENPPSEYCENKAINYILGPYINRAKYEGIAVDCRIELPESSKIPEIDLCIILSNAIDNAIKASLDIPDVSRRRIEIRCKSKSAKLLIEVTNNYVGDIEFEDYIPVSEEENRVFGAKSIRALVEKHNGLFSFTAEEGVFKLRIII